MAPFIHVKSAGVDIGFDAEELSLDEYGIAGRIVYTPGHTGGWIRVSIVVLIELAKPL